MAIVGLPSLAVTLAGLIGFRGLAYILVEDRSIGRRAASRLVRATSASSRPRAAAVPVLDLRVMRLRRCWCLRSSRSHLPGFGRYTYVIGNSGRSPASRACASPRTSSPIIDDQRIHRRAGRRALRGAPGRGPGSTAEGFELDIITMVLLGGVSIFGGSGTMVGVVLSSS